MIESLILYIFSFIAIWYGSGLIATSTSKFSEKLKLSPFAFSFVFLGILTSTPEISIGIQATVDRSPEIFVGNLIGGVIVIFLLIIPLLASFGNGISLKNELNKTTLLFSLLVIVSPTLAVLDNKISTVEGMIIIGLYLLLIFQIERKHGIFDGNNSRLLNIKSYSYKDVLKIISGIVLVFISSSIIVDKTLFFSGILGISSFYISLLVVSLGTNMPEFSLAVRSILLKHKDIAMGDYIGSAAANAPLFGIFTILNKGEIIEIKNFWITFVFVSIALVFFYLLSYLKGSISRKTGLIMLGFYIIFVILEFI